jgi:thiol-disulfide isomerase/thioredoxin
MATEIIRTLLLFTALLTAGKLKVQTVLKIGDTVPDIELGKFLEEPEKKMKVSDLKGKLIILDFWNNRCSICLTGMPKIDSLQKKFKDRVQFIAVTYNTEEEVKAVFKQIKIKKPDVPFIVSDRIFNSLFPHNGDPLHVWINKDGVVSAIAHYYGTNDETVSKFLNGIDPKLPRRWDFGYNVNYLMISEQNSGLLESAANYSVLFERPNEYTTDQYIFIHDNSITATHCEVLRFYQIAYNNELYGFNVNNIRLQSRNRIIFETSNQHRFFPPKEEDLQSDWIRKNVFSYEMKLPPAQSAQKFQRMREDLDRYFPFKATIEKRNVKCLALVATKLSTTLKSNGKSPLIEPMTSKSPLIIQNKPVVSLISELLYANTQFPMPIIDGTNIKYNIDLKLKSKLSDLEALNNELASFGLQLIEKEMKIEMLVIRDK